MPGGAVKPTSTPTPTPSSSVPTNYNDIPTSTTPSSTSSGTTTVWNIAVPETSQIFTGINPGQAANQDTPQKGVKNDPYQNATPQTNQYSSADDFFTSLVQMATQDPTSFESIQKQLWEAGFYGSSSADSLRLGVWNQQTASALKDAIQSYVGVSNTAGQPVTFSDWLTGQAQNGAASGGNPAGATGNAPTQVNLTDPVALKQAVTTAAQTALGHALTDDQVNAFVDSFHAQQTASQTSTAASTTTPDPSADAIQFAEGANPQEFSNNQAQAYTNAFLNMFLPSGSSASNITPMADVGSAS